MSDSMELRWLKVRGDEEGARHSDSAIKWAGPYWLVLQVRYREGPRGEGWWGEWHDLPVEEP